MNAMEPKALPPLERAAQGILRRFMGELERATAPRPAQSDEQAARAAARVALEHAVLQTAEELHMAPEAVAEQLSHAEQQTQASLIERGRAAIEQLYGVTPDALVGALAGRAVTAEALDVSPQSGGLDQMAQSSRVLVAALCVPKGSASALDLAQVKTHRDALVSQLAFVHSAIDARVAQGRMNPAQALAVRDRFETQVFGGTASGQGGGRESLYADVMAEVKTVTQSATVLQIAAKLDARFGAKEINPTITELTR